MASRKAARESLGPAGRLLEDNLTLIAMAGIAGAFVLWQQSKKKTGTTTIQGTPAIDRVPPAIALSPGVIGCDCGTEF